MVRTWPGCPLGGTWSAPAGIEDPETGRIALVNDQVAQAGRQRLGVFQLVRRAVAVEHRSARVQKDVADEIRLLLILLDGIAIGASVAFPVDVLDIVARDVFAVLDELHGEAAVGTAVVADP